MSVISINIPPLIKATPHNHRLTLLYIIRLHIFRHITQILLALRQQGGVEFRQSDEKSQLNFIELARDLTHNGCAVLPKGYLLYNYITALCENQGKMNNYEHLRGGQTVFDSRGACNPDKNVV
ncbi:MAG: hypothetical protein IKP47_07625 [Ruminococcus sp.]|nr:hypothetical protein [Ruminococcus sp.]